MNFWLKKCSKMIKKITFSKNIESEKIKNCKKHMLKTEGFLDASNEFVRHKFQIMGLCPNPFLKKFF